ncbi:MAG: PLP-dependent aminotransferase family protein [Acidimicrobiales bacterium]
MTTAFRQDLPAPAGSWGPPPRFSFVGGHNDDDSIPFAGLAEAAVTSLSRDGRQLATYNLGGSPLGLRSLREQISGSLGARAGLRCDPDQVLITSGSLQALDLVNQAMLTAGDTVLVEQATYGGMLSRLQALGVTYVGVQLDDDGIDVDDLEAVLDELGGRGVSPKYLYTIPTVQNPTGSVMPEERRRRLLDVARHHDLPIFEDDCYAELTWDGDRPPSIQAIDGDGGQVIYCGSFSKTIGPALRVGYLVGPPAVIQQLLALKTDAGTGAVEQLTLAEFAPTHFDAHVEQLVGALRAKCTTMLDALDREFGDSISIREPQGGIFVWVTFNDDVDTTALVPAATEAGIEFNPGAGWSADPADGRRRLRLCFGHVDAETINEGVAALARIVREQVSRRPKAAE